MSADTLAEDAVFSPAAVQQPLSAHVSDALQRAIASGALKPGQRVNEAELARQMHISRGPVREAIRGLEQAGLLRAVPRRGTVVVTLSANDIEEVYTLRADLETRAIRRAVERLSEDERAALDRQLDMMERAAGAGDLPALLDADIAFHRQLVAAAGWPHLLHMWESLRPRTLTLFTLQTLNSWTPLTHAERHRPVLDAVRAGKVESAALAIREHILGVGAELLRLASVDERTTISQEVRAWAPE